MAFGQSATSQPQVDDAKVVDQDAEDLVAHLRVHRKAEAFIRERANVRLAVWRKQAQENHPAAQYLLGLAWLYGTNEEGRRSEVDAISWYEKAAAGGFPPAQTAFGIRLMQGKGVEKDEKRGAEMLVKAANQGFFLAQCNVASLYRAGVALQKNEKAAFDLNLKAANQRHSFSEYHMGLHYLHGVGTSVDLDQAYEWFEKAAHAKELASLAIARMAQLREEGTPKRPSDAKEAANLLKLSLRSASSEDQELLRDILSHSQHRTFGRWYLKQLQDARSPELNERIRIVEEVLQLAPVQR